MTRVKALKRFSAPHRWDAIDEEIARAGAAVIANFASAPLVEMLNSQADRFLELSAIGRDALPGLPNTESDSYNRFLGRKTVRLHGLVEKLPAVIELIETSSVVSWARRALAPVATTPRLSAGEFIQIQPAEPRQLPHRDSDSWPLPVGEHPLVVNAIVALTEFSTRNGATWVAPGSFGWRPDHRFTDEDFLQATMSAGDALLFRGDLVHGAGANNSANSRRAISLSFCAGWLRPVENSVLNLKLETVRKLRPELQQILGFAAYDGSERGNGLLGLYENGDPAALFTNKESSSADTL